MYKKTSIIIFTLIIINLIFVLPIFADNDIDMNINGNTVSNKSTDNNTATNDTTEENSTSNTNSSVNQSYNTGNRYTQSSATVSTTNDDEFGITNILNVMLIVIGILLILLAIAILIRLKN